MESGPIFYDHETMPKPTAATIKAYCPKVKGIVVANHAPSKKGFRCVACGEIHKFYSARESKKPA